MSERAAAIRPWPRWMRAETAARFVGAPSIEAFQAKIPDIYPAGLLVPGTEPRWFPEDLSDAEGYPIAWPDPTAGMRLYFMRSEPSGYIKIGVSKNVDQRRRQLQLTNPEELKVIFDVDGWYQLETAFHKAFAEHRLRGEWFSPAPVILQTIARLIAGEEPVAVCEELLEALQP